MSALPRADAGRRRRSTAQVLLWDKDNQELWDKIADTYVVDNA